MTPLQITALLTCGPLGTMLFLNGVQTMRGKTSRDLDLPQAVVFFLCVVLIALSFVGVS